MIYYFLLADLIALVLVYIVYVLWKNKTTYIPSPTGQLLLIPTLISSLIILWYCINGSNNYTDIRKNEYVAIGMKHYNDWKKTFIGNNKIIQCHELFTGV